MASRRTRNTGVVIESDPIIRLWLLRLLMPLGGHRNFLHSNGFQNETLANAIGLGHWVAVSNDEKADSFIQASRSCSRNLEAIDFDLKKVKSELRQLHQKAEKLASKTTLSGCLRHNIDQLADLVGLSATDCRVLEFAVTIHTEQLLDDTADWLGSLSSVKVFHVLATLLSLPESEVRASLSAQGILATSGLVSVERCSTTTLRNKLNLLSDAFADLMATSNADPIALLRGTVSAVPPGELNLLDYDHIRSSLDIVLPYLKHATNQGRRGVNIFLHGAPGTGKSQLARALAGELQCELFEVASEDEDGDPVNGERRLRAFRAAQSFFSQRRALVVFDEVEDVFNDGDFFGGRKSTAQVRKAWINRMLEENPVPTLWLSNSIAGLDPAFIRRFDMVFELPVPPKKHRERILKESCGDLLDEKQISRIAEADSLAPAVVVRAGAVVRTIRHELGEENAATAFEHLLSNTLEAQGHRPLIQNDLSRLPEVYDPAFIHADADLEVVVTGLKSCKAGRICLYGPPGTGKTAYGRWVAAQLGVPLLVKRASDLLAPFVGENERNIAHAFRCAQSEGAVLLIDEVDTFLRDRRGAQRDWEANLVNEMLIQMESFPGVFIASTNLMDGLDQAALRRFDLKVKFDFMRADQAWELLSRHCTCLGLALPSADIKERVSRMDNLTPGDFAAVLRRNVFSPLKSVSALVSALESECSVKEGTQRSIGFM